MTRPPSPVRPLDDLLADVERAFAEGRGSERVDDLSEAHPEHAETLVEFLDAMLRAALAPSPDPVASARTTAALADRLDARGRPDLAAEIREAGGLAPADAEDSTSDAACPVYTLSAHSGRDDRETTARRAGDRPAVLGTCFPDYARQKLGLNLKRLAFKLGVKMRFLREIDENPSQAPSGALDEMARRAAAIGLDEAESRLVLESEPERSSGFAKAASGSDGVRQATGFSYLKLVETCFRDDPEAKAFWSSFDR